MSIAKIHYHESEKKEEMVSNSYWSEKTAFPELATRIALSTRSNGRERERLGGDHAARS